MSMKAGAALTFLSTEVQRSLALSQITARLPSQSVILGGLPGESLLHSGRPARESVTCSVGAIIGIK